MFEDFGLDFELSAARFVLNVHRWVYFRILAGNCLLTLGHACFTTNCGSISMNRFIENSGHLDVNGQLKNFGERQVRKGGFSF